MQKRLISLMLQIVTKPINLFSKNLNFKRLKIINKMAEGKVLKFVLPNFLKFILSLVLLLVNWKWIRYCHQKLYGIPAYHNNGCHHLGDLIVVL